MNKIIFMLYHDDEFDGYAESFRGGGIEVKTFNSEQEILKQLECINPSMFLIVNYFNHQEDATEFLTKIREFSQRNICIVSKERASAEFVQMCDELKNISSMWGDEIDLDFTGIPYAEILKEESEEQRPKDNDIVDLLTYTPVTIEEVEPEIEITLEKETPPIIPAVDIYSILPDTYNCNFKDMLATKQIVDIHTFEELLTIDLKESSVIISSTSLCNEHFEILKGILKKIPKTIRFFVLCDLIVNNLVIGELERNGIKFYDSLEDVINAIVPIEPVPEEPLSEQKTDGKKLVFNFTKKASEAFGVVSQKVGSIPSQVTEIAKNIPKPNIAKLQFPKIEMPTPKEKKEKIKIKVSGTTTNYIERKKIMVFVSPESTGKTEIAVNVAASMAEKGIKTALVDLDLNKKGMFYNFKIANQIDFYNYRQLCLMLNDYGDLEKDILEYSFKYSKNLFVFTSHRDIEIPIDIKALSIFLRFLKSAVDVIVVDVGKGIPQEILEKLFDFESVSKYLVTTEDIGILNTVPYSLKWMQSTPFYYRDWNLIVNQHPKELKLKQSELHSFFYDKEIPELNFKINNTFYIPTNNYIWQEKQNRAFAYGKDAEFDTAIDNVVESWQQAK